MANPPLTTAEIQQCKNLLGYPNVTVLANPIIGTSRVFEDVLQQFADDFGIGYIRNTILPNITTLETELFAARSRYKVDRAEDYTQDKAEHRRYIRQRNFWIDRLVETTGIKRFAKQHS